MSRKGHTEALSASVRNERTLAKAEAQLADLEGCVEFYRENSADYTDVELATLEEALQIQRDNVHRLQNS